MKKIKIYIFFPLFLGIWLLIPPPARPQLVLGQYEDEAPFRTWNTFAFTTAPSLGRGETSFAIATDCSVALANPALLPYLPKMTLALNGSFNFASLYKFSLVNTGVLFSEGNITHGFYALDFAGLSLRLKSWAFALLVAVTESYDRPPCSAEEIYSGMAVYKLALRQKGILRNLNFSVARKISQRLSAGLALNFVLGSIEREIIERWEFPTVIITDRKSQDFQGFFLNGGVLFYFSDKFQAAAIFRTPYIKKSKSESLLNYRAPAGNTEINITASADDTYKQPLVLGAGLSYRFSPEFRLAADLIYHDWSHYSVEYFEEEQRRDFKSTVKIGVGAEYMSFIRLFGRRLDYPLRFGIIYDPQPMKEPNSSYFNLSLGAGFHWKNILLDLGTLIGKETGSGDSLSARKVAISLSFRL